ncbi:TPA: TetR/AcrR family transcriptional regulator [Enterococcus faecium]
MKQEQKSIMTKTKILKVAMQLFIEKGYTETTMQDILSQSGLSKGAIYHHFRSKNEILEFAMDSELKNVTTYLESLANSKEYSATEKIDSLINFLLSNDSMKNLSKSNWSEKIPFGLLYTLRNTVNVLSHHIGKIIEQGNENAEFNCAFPFETASVLLLLIDVWLDPVIVDSTFLEISRKIDYISYFLNSNNVPILSEEKCKEIKKTIKPYYEK